MSDEQKDKFHDTEETTWKEVIDCFIDCLKKKKL